MESSSPSCEVVTQIPALARRPADSNKGNFGRVLVVAGSQRMSGAAVLCANAALRGGAGLVFLAVPEGILLRAAMGNACYLTVPLPQDEHGQLADRATPELLDLIPAHNVVALGPGLGQSPGITSLVLQVLAGTQQPLVLDADGLNALQRQPEHLRSHAGPLILTPHPGEFARLTGCTVADIQAQRQELALDFAREHGVVLVLKGHKTIVTDGRLVYHNSTGNPGMATGGTGDVLTGLIASLVGQGLEPFAAAVLGVYVHGLAGDLARDAFGEVSVIASDLIDYLPAAFRIL